MEKFYNNLKMCRYVLYALTAIFLVLQLAWGKSILVALVCAILALFNLAVVQILKYKDLKENIEKGYDLYLADCLKDGIISNAQYEEKSRHLYPVYAKMYKSDKIVKIAFFIMFFGLAITLLAIFFKEIL